MIVVTPDQGFSPAQARALKVIDGLRMATLLVALLGVSFAVDSLAADPLAPKTFWASFGILLFITLSVMRLWWGGRVFVPGGGAGKATLGLIAALVLSATLSPVRPVSSRALGAWFLILVWIYAVRDWALGASPRARVMCWILTACLGIAGLLALLPPGLLGLEWARSAEQIFGGRASGTFGNPNFLGGFVVLLWPIAAYLAWTNQGSRRALSLAFLSAGLAAVLASGSRAAWIGLLAQAALIAHLFFWSNAASSRRGRALSATGLGLGTLIILGSLIPQAHLAQRVVDVFRGQDQAVRFRLETWRGSFRAGLARPLQGHGPGSFAAVYPAFRPTETMAWQSQHSYEITHPENWLVQLWVELGLLGLGLGVTFLALLLWPLRLASRDWDRDPEARLALALLVALSGSLVTNLGSLDLFLPSTYLPFTMLLGLALARFGQTGGRLGLNPESGAAFLVSLGLLLVVSQPIFGAWLNWSASRALASAKQFSKANNVEAALPMYRRALDADALNLEARYFYASALQERAKPQDLEEAERQYGALATLAPDYVLIHEKRGRLAQTQGRWADAQREFARQVRLDPYLETAWDGLAHSLFAQGQVAESIAALDEAITYNRGSKTLYNSRGVARAGSGQLPLAVRDFMNALHLDPDYDEARLNQAEVSIALKLRPAAINMIETVLAKHPQHPRAKALLKLARARS